MLRRYALLLTFAIACGDQHGATSPTTPGSPDLHVGDWVVYRFSGTFTDKPITLREEVIALDAARITIDVRATRGREERRWTQIGPSTADARWNNTVEEIEVTRDGKKERLPNPNNVTLARLYDWVIVGAEGERTAGASAQCEETIASTRYACTCTKATAKVFRIEESRCPTFAWQHGPARWANGNGDVVWQVEVVEVHSRTSVSAGTVVGSTRVALK